MTLVYIYLFSPLPYGSLIRNIVNTTTTLKFLPNLHNPLKIFAGLTKLLHVFLLGTENVIGVGEDSGSGLW